MRSGADKIAQTLPGWSATGSAFGSEAYAFTVASNAAIGCASAAASGGKCGAGALSGAVSAAASPLLPNDQVGGLIGHSVVGGLASVAGGGKFENGAVTGAFGYLFKSLPANSNDPNQAYACAMACPVVVPAILISDALLGTSFMGLILGGSAWVIINTPLNNDQKSNVPPLPDGLVGENAEDSSGQRKNTDLPPSAFPGTVQDLTGGNLAPDPNKPGHLVAPNGVRVRPGVGDKGPRIDIPANGAKPPETIHFPSGTRWPW